ncbi:phosphatidylserine decarboxylase [Morchella snyderi]|nr:phosphatidylserine decarboxylase [Morchella snyderi]
MPVPPLLRGCPPLRLPRAPPPALRSAPLAARRSPTATALPLPLPRHFSATPPPQHQRYPRRPPSFFARARHSWNDTKVEWYTIPVGLGILVVALSHLRKRDSSTSTSTSTSASQEKPIRPMGAWQVQVLSTLPLKALSYYWGVFNEIPLPAPLRVPGFKLYAWIFGVNLAEAGEDDLRAYRNLAEFFYRSLKPGVRPIDPREGAVVSPADGRVLQFGEVHAGGLVEQVKGMTYSLDALLGGAPPAEGAGADTSPNPAEMGGDADREVAHVASDEEFANVNGISYTLPSLLSGGKDDVSLPQHATTSAVATVGRDLARGSWWGGSSSSSSGGGDSKRLFFAVVYLAPGDYHRFHSPVSWVVERRRHFSGELYSVSPWLQSRLPGLFTLNERVVLLGRWKHGMFSMTPVGATNVGSIKINFDRELRTNSLTHDATRADSEGGYAEASYRGASVLLGGHPVAKGGEIGGFNLGSTVVLVFEAPAAGPDGRGGFRFKVERGQYVKVGEALGVVEDP